MNKILLIGCGHMGTSLLSSWVKAETNNIFVVDPIQSVLLKRNKKYSNVKFYKSLNQINDFLHFNIIVFAMKPVDLTNVLDELENKKFKKNCIAISVIAGKKIKEFKNSLKSINQFVRVMPNMPALIGEGMNCIVLNKSTSKKNKNLVRILFEYTGTVLFLKNENEIDMATAVSGSGPGYVFNLIDAMEKASIKLGFSKKISQILVAKTFKGSINLLMHSNLSAEDLTKTVATKGGTTEAGLKVMNQNKIHNVFKKLVKSAYQKAKMQGRK